MSLSVNRVGMAGFLNPSFGGSKRNAREAQNPVSQRGEMSKLFLGTFVAGLGFGTKMLAELLDGDFAIEHLFKAGDSVAEKNFKNASKNKRAIASVGATVGLVGIFIAAMAVVYTLFKTPKIAYESKINSFKKSKDMDVYIKGNEIEKDLYTQMNEKAQKATDDEKVKLKQQYLMMQMAKNRVPDFIQLS